MPIDPRILFLILRSSGLPLAMRIDREVLGLLRDELADGKIFLPKKRKKLQPRKFFVSCFFFFFLGGEKNFGKLFVFHKSKNFTSELLVERCDRSW